MIVAASYRSGSLPDMTRFAAFALAFAALALTACKTTKKPSAHIYEGNAPSIHFHDPQDAGGPVRSKRYR